ncbi:MAG: hypothetical protein WBQ73_03900 [Candidatus Babeliales bacterium]
MVKRRFLFYSMNFVLCMAMVINVSASGASSQSSIVKWGNIGSSVVNCIPEMSTPMKCLVGGAAVAGTLFVVREGLKCYIKKNKLIYDVVYTDALIQAIEEGGKDISITVGNSAKVNVVCEGGVILHKSENKTNNSNNNQVNGDLRTHNYAQPQRRLIGESNFTLQGDLYKQFCQKNKAKIEELQTSLFGKKKLFDEFNKKCFNENNINNKNYYDLSGAKCGFSGVVTLEGFIDWSKNKESDRFLYVLIDNLRGAYIIAADELEDGAFKEECKKFLKPQLEKMKDKDNKEHLRSFCVTETLSDNFKEVVDCWNYIVCLYNQAIDLLPRCDNDVAVSGPIYGDRFTFIIRALGLSQPSYFSNFTDLTKNTGKTLYKMDDGDDDDDETRITSLTSYNKNIAKIVSKIKLNKSDFVSSRVKDKIATVFSVVSEN